MVHYFYMGIQHITDIEGYDHMLFLAALCAPFIPKQWKPVVILATAFTLGHSISLALAALGIITFNRDLIELLIAITILITAVLNFFIQQSDSTKTPVLSYVITSIFGVIHGMGFSGFFGFIAEDTQSIVRDLFLFNLGVEAGQIIIIGLFMLCVYVLLRIGVPHKFINWSVSGLAILVSAWLITQRF